MDGINSIQALPQAEHPEQYGTEVLCAGWTPELPASAGPAAGTRERAYSADIREVESFLARFYQAQRT